MTALEALRFEALGGRCELYSVPASQPTDLAAVRAWVVAMHDRLTRFTPSSELSRINAGAGRWIDVSPELGTLLRRSLTAYTASNGLVHIGVLPALLAAGYTRDFSAGPTPSTGEILIPPPLPEMLEVAAGRARLRAGTAIDLGGIAKGWIVEKAAQLLHQYVDICGVSAGGDILFMGHPLDRMDWDVYLEDPRSPVEMLAQLHIPSGAVATSSIMKRAWSQGEQVRHHLIDPRTGEPAQTDWLSVTVISPSVITADVYAKAILIAGEKELPNLLNEKQDLTFIAVDSEGKLSGSPNYKEYIYEFTSEPF